jgi:hypothetical protein
MSNALQSISNFLSSYIKKLPHQFVESTQSDLPVLSFFYLSAFGKELSMI